MDRVELKKELGQQRYHDLEIVIKDLSKKKDKEMYYKYLIEFVKKHKHNNYNDQFIYRYISQRIHYDNNIKTFQKNLKYYMDMKNKSVAELSKDLNISYSTVSDWYNGVNFPRADTMGMLADYFNVTSSELIEEHKANNKVPVLGNIPAGIPIEAIEYIDDYEEIPSDWLNSDKQYFALTIKGDSMIPKYETRRYCYI